MKYSPVVDAIIALRAGSVSDGERSVADASGSVSRYSLEKLFAPQAFVDRNAALACLSGLHLLANDLDNSHRISQDLATPEGSFWHGIMHRREGDCWNAKYWFRKVGPHPVYDELERQTGKKWDPLAFVDRVERHHGDAECLRLQELEWRALFDFCWQSALGEPGA